MRQYAALSAKARLYKLKQVIVERHTRGNFKYLVIRQWTRKYEKQTNEETKAVFTKLAKDWLDERKEWAMPDEREIIEFQALSLVNSKQVDKELRDKEPRYSLEDYEKDEFSPRLGDFKQVHEEDVEPSAQIKIDAI